MASVVTIKVWQEKRDLDRNLSPGRVETGRAYAREDYGKKGIVSDNGNQVAVARRPSEAEVRTCR